MTTLGSDLDKRLVQQWQRHADGIWGDKGVPEDRRGVRDHYASITRELGWWRERHPHAFRQLVTTDARAKRIADAQGWRAGDGQEDWGDTDAVGVRRKIRMIQDSALPLFYGRFLATILRKHATHHLGLLPPAWLSEQGEAPNVVHLRLAAAPVPAEVKRSEPVDDS